MSNVSNRRFTKRKAATSTPEQKTQELLRKQIADRLRKRRQRKSGQ